MSDQSQGNTERDRRQQSRQEGETSFREKQGTDRSNLHYDSPTKYDIDFYQRKVNRLENDIATLQDQLSMARFKINKTEELENKNQILFKQNQTINNDLQQLSQENGNLRVTNDNLRAQLSQAQLQIKTKDTQLNAQRKQAEDQKKRHESHKSKFSNEGAQQKAAIESSFQRQIDILKSQAKDKQNKLIDQLTAAQNLIATKENVEAGLNFKIQKIKQDKDAEIDRLKTAMTTLRDQNSKLLLSCDQKLTDSRTQLIQETEYRIEHVRNLTKTIQQALIIQIRNLNTAIKCKDAEIQFLLETEKNSMDDHEKLNDGLKQHIKRLQDKIFILQRQNEIQLFKTIDRLKSTYDQNIANMNEDINKLQESYEEKMKDLNNDINNLKRENKLLDHENRTIEGKYKKLAEQKESAISMLSQKIINIQAAKDDDMKNYTISMRNIQEDAKTKLQDLHASIQNKNTQFEILNSQLALKNGEITYLLSQIDKLRSENRQKMRKLQTTNEMEQNSLNDMITSYKQQKMQMKKRIHQLEAQFSDAQSQAKLKYQLLREDLNLQKEANEKLRAQNNFLVQWCKELQNQLKKERVANVDVLHDHTVSRRQTVQIREQIKTQFDAIKAKEIQQLSNVFKLEKGRLESQLATKEHQLRDKKAQLGRLLVQYKNLEKKVGKSSKLDKGSEQNGKCQATLDAEILLTENIYNAINRP